MRSLLLLLMFACCSVTAQAGDFWSSLWRNADQQGERLMHEGKPAAAAQTYRDPRHKAYAELQAGDYANAAKHFSTLDDSNGNYNRGNALAHAGQLQEALKAYEAALAHDPSDKDARHNRDLVAKTLQQQAPKQQSSSDKDKSSQDSKNGDKQQPSQSGNDADHKDQGKQGESKSNQNNQNSSAQQSSGQERNGKAQADQAGQGKTGNSNDKPSTGQEQQQSAQGQPSTTQTDTSESSKALAQGNDATQAKQDAAAALGKEQGDNARIPSVAPVSEQKLAQEQWLRAIPDDPGGLLRRKFMIEHLIRQQGGQQ